MTIDEQLRAIREELERIHSKMAGQGGLPTLLTQKHAARELSVSVSTVKLLIKRRELLTVPIGKRRMVPASEIRRLASTDEKTSAPKPVRSGLQDPEAGRAKLRRR